MRILLDECVPWPMHKLLSGHSCSTVQDVGWGGIKNGDLLQGAEGQFDLFIRISLARGFISAAFFAPPAGVNITEAYGGNAVTVYSNTTGTVTNGTAFAINSPPVLGSLKPTTQYGMRIKVMVDATRHPIKIGDLLVTSDKPGAAQFRFQTLVCALLAA